MTSIATDSGMSYPKTYSELFQKHPIRPIHDEADLEITTGIIHQMAGYELNQDQTDYLEMLCLAVEEYESAHYPLAADGLKGIDALRALMAENDMTAGDLSKLLGAQRSLGSKILNGTRNLTIDHIKALSERFAVRADLFVA